MSDASMLSGLRAGGGDVASSLARWLNLAAAPVFGALALWTGLFGGGPHMLCMSAAEASPLDGMSLMYVLMCAVHAAPWLRLVSSRRG